VKVEIISHQIKMAIYCSLIFLMISMKGERENEKVNEVYEMKVKSICLCTK
jgi:hypothetical protein